MAAVRQQITIDVSSRAVWNALTTEEGVTSWWVDEARLDPREGGRVVLVTGEGDERVELRGTFHKVKPTRVIELSFDSVGKADGRGTQLQFQVGRNGGETKLHVVQSGGAVAEDEETAERVDAFWKDALTKLRDGLEG